MVNIQADIPKVEQTLKKGGEKEYRDEKGRFTKDYPGGPGRPQGLRDFSTDFEEAVEEIAKEENITISEARKILLKVAYKEAKSGKFPFYKDTMDRYYGETKKPIDITTKGEKIGEIEPKLQSIINEFEDKLKKRFKDD